MRVELQLTLASWLTVNFKVFLVLVRCKPKCKAPYLAKGNRCQKKQANPAKLARYKKRPRCGLIRSEPFVRITTAAAAFPLTFLNEYAFLVSRVDCSGNKKRWLHTRLARLILKNLPTSVNQSSGDSCPLLPLPSALTLQLSGLVSSSRPLLFHNPPLPPKRRHIFLPPLPCIQIFFF